MSSLWRIILTLVFLWEHLVPRGMDTHAHAHAHTHWYPQGFSMTEETSTLSPLLHLSFYLLSAESPPSIHFLHQAAISHSVHLTFSPLRRPHLPLSLPLSSFSLYRVVSADSSGRDKVLMLGLKVTAPVLQPHSWGARDPSPHGIHRAARRQRRTDGRRRGWESERAGGRRVIGRLTTTHSANQGLPHHCSVSTEIYYITCKGIEKWIT